MLDRLSQMPTDPLLGLMSLFRADDRAFKIDLGVGIYRDDTGRTPVMRAVKTAERMLCDQQATKAYVGARGDTAFLASLQDLVLGPVGGSPVASVQTPGGTGALRLGAELLARSGVGQVLIGQPAWANHEPIFAAAGLTVAHYAHYDRVAQDVDFGRVMQAVRSAPANSAVLLQASCHNPTGADLTFSQWCELATALRAGGLVPFIDVAYQGFGEGLGDDVAGLREVLACSDNALVAVSCSKSFGLYRERTGALYAVSQKPAAAESHMQAIARANYSMPPDHGAAVVRTILESPDLRRVWEQELAEARRRVRQMRETLAELGARRGVELSFLPRQKGMFSLAPVDARQIAELRDGHGVYLVGDGRMNLAGLRSEDAERVVDAFRAVGL